MKASAVTLYLSVALGAALGGVGRFWVSGVVTRLLGETFPWGTLTVNVLGSALLAFFATVTGPGGRVFAPAPLRVFVGMGLCGGFTTFSTFSLETLNLAREGEVARAAGNIGANLLFCLVGAAIGFIVAGVINQR